MLDFARTPSCKAAVYTVSWSRRTCCCGMRVRSRMTYCVNKAVWSCCWSHTGSKRRALTEPSCPGQLQGLSRTASIAALQCPCCESRIPLHAFARVRETPKSTGKRSPKSTYCAALTDILHSCEFVVCRGGRGYSPGPSVSPYRRGPCLLVVRVYDFRIFGLAFREDVRVEPMYRRLLPISAVWKCPKPSSSCCRSRSVL